MKIARYAQRPIAWTATGDPRLPYRAELDGRRLRLRVNDFPAEVLYTVLADGEPDEPVEEWPALWLRPRAGLAIPTALWASVCAAYGGAGRAYHDLRHVGEVLERYDEVARVPGWTRPAEVLLALLMHDAVYVAGRHDNEAESAALARDAVARWLPDAGLDVGRIEALILLTARHGALAPGDVDAEAALFLDCDMSILGAQPARYDAYERDVAAEYAAVPRELYAAGRRAFLERLLASPRIFLSDHFHARLDAAARANLRRALQSIG
jgi:predicted metal-dependent HD superfamily phosphohydrolase